MPRRAELPNLHPARLDMTHYRGDSLSATLRFQSRGVPVDVSSLTFLAFIRDSPNGSLIAQFTILTNGEGTDPVNGVIRLWLPFQVARLLPPSCVWDLEATQYDLNFQPYRVRTLMRGFIYTTDDVTYQQSDLEEILNRQTAGG